MSLIKLKQSYWSMLNAINRRINPRETVLTPHDWKQAIQNFTDINDRVVFFDGGAHNGEFASNFCKSFRNIEVHAFEPNPELLDTLQDNITPWPHTINPMALGEEPGHTMFNIGESPMTSSVLSNNENGRAFYNDVIRTKETLTVPVTSLDEYAKQNNINRIDILKLDLQGYELHALKGARQLLENKQISCIFTEINFMPFYDGSALFSDLDQYLRKMGYQLHNLYNLATRNSNQQLTGGDALFIPNTQHVNHQLRIGA